MCNAAHVARACLAGFMLVILSASLAEAEYGPRTVFGANYQQTSNTLSALGTTGEEACNGYGICAVLFQKTPGQKRLIVHHVSCAVTTSNVAIRRVTLLSRKGQQTPPRRLTYLTPIKTGDSTKTIWNVNSPVMHLIESGERPLVLFDTGFGSDWVAECTIAGKLLQP